VIKPRDDPTNLLRRNHNIPPAINDSNDVPGRSIVAHRASGFLPLPLHIPQIGNIVFSAAANGMVVGRTDQGCAWTFTVRSDSLELSEAQSCFNHNIGSAYTLTRWSVTVVGNHERETIIGISHQPTGDLVTTMHDGAAPGSPASAGCLPWPASSAPGPMTPPARKPWSTCW
jgi:hypothetical protein